MSFLDFFTRSDNEVAKLSRRACLAIKSGRPEQINKAVQKIVSTPHKNLDSFIGNDSILVPIPRSSKVPSGGIWPANEIALALFKNGFGANVIPILERTKAIRKSSSISVAAERPSVKEHHLSLAVTQKPPDPPQLVLIDDVVTIGRTAVACAIHLKAAFPKAKIRFFAMVRTQSLIKEPTEIYNLRQSHIELWSDGRVIAK